MDKKKIQIGVIVGCMVVTAGVLYFGLGGGGEGEVAPPAPDPITGLPPTDTLPSQGGTGGVSNLPSAGRKTEYAAPAVFPSSSALDLSVFDSSQFRNLQDYVPLTVAPEEIGRENPFDPYTGN